MAGEIQIGGTTFATESGGTVTVSNVDSATNRTNLGLGSIATQAADSIDINGGTIDGTTIGGTSAAAGTFTTFTSTGIDDNASSTALTIDSSGNLLVGTTDSLPVQNNASGIALRADGNAQFSRSGAATARFNRGTSDGEIVSFHQDGTTEGSISVSGASVTYGPFTGSHWSRLLDGSKPDIPRGTILESLDEMMDWVKEDGTLEDDIKHVKCKISDTVESKNVYGLFFAWDNDDDYNDLNVAQEGSFVIRIHSSQDVQRGDLIQSNGDGTGKIQADDIIRSSTVAKVISNHRVETYEDGSYIVPCVIHC